MTLNGASNSTLRKNYEAPEFLVPKTSLTICIRNGGTSILSRLQIERCGEIAKPLVLDGEGLSIKSLSIDGIDVEDEAYVYTEGRLVIWDVPDKFTFESHVIIEPEKNFSLEGLYRSRTIYCTQCEAEGFRKITFFPDRPDVLSIFTVTLEADRLACPVLLSNGNLIKSTALANGRHLSTWHDPFPKPCYLFAVVAGDLVPVEDVFTTVSGREVHLRIWVEIKDQNYCGYAMQSLKAAMRWDEIHYGLEYDLELYNIVAVDDFNMGAMENKSLNIFNTSCVLAHPDITTDSGYQRIEGVVAHEYFHNYSGNRVTCRDWFQLSLKEGFTVYRDAEFSADMNSRGVKRVEDVMFLQTHQFAEDAGPMSHPIRPDSYMEISNFYTFTVYEKGAEVVRMLSTLLGEKAFYQGAKFYFEYFDGQAVTCDDFVTAMEHTTGKDLTQFRRWYEQSGTPELRITESYDRENSRLTLTLSQCNPSASGEKNNPPLLMPVTVRLLVQGEKHPLAPTEDHRVLELKEYEQTFEFEDINERPVVSALRGFSAPVRLVFPQSRTDRLALIADDDDPFVKWNAATQLFCEALDAVADHKSLPDDYVEALRAVITGSLDEAFKAQLLSLPSEEYLSDRAAHSGRVDVQQIHLSRRALARKLGMALQEEWLAAVEWNNKEDYVPNAAQIGRRALKHLALFYVVAHDEENVALAEALYFAADNLTDRLGGARQIVHFGNDDKREEVLNHFYDHWKHEALVVNQWFLLQATRPQPSTCEVVRLLSEHEAFDWRNPNKLRSLIGAFANGNPIAFHRADGEGYRILADAVARLHGQNPQIAARMLTPLTRWRRYEEGSGLMVEQLERLAGIPDLARDVYEVVSRSLALN